MLSPLSPSSQSLNLGMVFGTSDAGNQIKDNLKYFPINDISLLSKKVQSPDFAMKSKFG